MHFWLCRQILLLSLLPGSLVAAQTSPVRSELQFESSDAKLVQAFQWAKSQALAYAHEGNDPVGPWYEAALPGRDAFCMRDVSHQAEGAAALGLYAENRNMLGRFAASQSQQRDWAAFWEIDRTGNPSPADYVSDKDFWYNLPANFDLLDSTVRMWQWTGDDTYLSAPAFQHFFTHTAMEYLNTWSLDPDRILQRPRIMNQTLAIGKFVHSRGIPSYTEGKEDFNLGTDLLASAYRAFRSLELVARTRQQAALAQRYGKQAEAFSKLIEEKAWSQQDKHFAGFFSADAGTQGSGDELVLYFRATQNPEHIRAALAYIETPDYLGSIGIENETYLAQTFYAYDEKSAAYDRILDLARPDKERREYPEVSFSVIGAIVSGAMGIDVTYDPLTRQSVLHSLARLPMPGDKGAIRGLRIGKNRIDLEHRGDGETSLTNRSGPTLHWQPFFNGRVSHMRVNGRSIPAISTLTILGMPRSSTQLDVAPGKTVVVQLER